MLKGNKESSWTFLSNHAHVILCLANNNSMLMRNIAQKVGITERAVHQIIADLVESGYITRLKEGRCNKYKIKTEKNLRHSIENLCKIGGLIDFVENAKEEI